MNLIKKVCGMSLLLTGLNAGAVEAAEYVIDGSGMGMHAGVSFRASHVGISALWGRFNDINGSFSYDKDAIGASSISVSIDPASIDTNHEARDEHLRSGDYLDVKQYPEAGFVSTSIADLGMGKLQITGDFTLHGVTREISFVAERTGEGETPFGDYRVGFEAETVLDVSEFGINLFPDPELTLVLAIEGVRQ